MRYLRKNTAVIITVGPYLDKTDGVTLETGLTISNERISFVVDLDNGSAPTLVLDNVTGATSGTANDLNYIANCDAGLMQLELAAADVNYVGRAFLTITDAANHRPVFHEFTILPAQVYDSLILGTDLLQADSTQLAGTTLPGALVSLGGTMGAGSETVIITCDDGTNPLEGVAVWVTTDVAGTDVKAGTLYSDTFGHVTMKLDPGTYAVWKQGGANWDNPTAIVVVAT